MYRPDPERSAGPRGPFAPLATRESVAGPALGLFLLALAVRLIGVGYAPLQLDELYHLLAARSWLADGSFAIGEGSYDRARGYTVLVALAMRLFGDGLVAARLPAVLAGAALAPAVFVVLGRAGGRVAAWIAGLGIALSAEAIGVAQFTRFYALHALLFWLGVAATYAMVIERPTVGRALAAAASLAGALYLQLTTVLGLPGLALWCAAAVAGPGLVGLRPLPRVALLLAGIAALGVAILVVQHSGAWATFRHASLWAAHRRGDLLFYHHILADEMPILWYLLPLAAVFALRQNPRFASLALLLLATALALHSLAGMKAQRYVFYLLPYILAVWALAAAYLLPALLAACREVARAPKRAASLAAGVLLAAMAGNPEYVDTARALAGDMRALGGRGGIPDPPWSDERRRLAGLVAAAPPGALLVTTDDLRAMHYLGGYGVLLNRARLDELAHPADFARDPRTGRPVIGSLGALRLLIACHPTGLVLVGPEQWAPAPVIDAATRTYLHRTTRRVLAGPIELFRWDTSRVAPPETCRGV